MGQCIRLEINVNLDYDKFDKLSLKKKSPSFCPSVLFFNRQLLPQSLCTLLRWISGFWSSFLVGLGIPYKVFTCDELLVRGELNIS